MKFRINAPQVICFEGEDGGDGDAGAAAAAQAAAAQAAKAAAEQSAAAAKAAAEKAAADKAAADKLFSQRDVDEIVVKRNKTLRAEYEKLESNYTGLLQQANLSSEQRAKLESDLENVQAQLRTKEQQIEHERRKAAEKHQTEVEKVSKERDHYKNMFETSTVERAITDAALMHDGFNSEIFIALLAPKAKMVEETDKLGAKTGKLVPQIEWAVKDDAGGQTMVRKSPAEIVELMKDDSERYGNMFKSNVARGVGSGTAAGSGNPGQVGAVNHKKITDAEYMKLRETPEGRAALGLPPARK